MKSATHPQEKIKPTREVLASSAQEERRMTTHTHGSTLANLTKCQRKCFLTVGVIAQSRVEEDAGLLLGLLGHVDGHVQVLDPLPHLHLGAGTTKSRPS